MKGHAYAVQYFRKRNIPLILLGGGGYTVKNVARAWTYETACAIGMEHDMDLNMPWNQYFEWFGPTYRLDVLESNMVDDNVKDNTLDLLRFVLVEIVYSLSINGNGLSPEKLHWLNCRSSTGHHQFKSKMCHVKVWVDTLDLRGKNGM